VPTAPPQHDSRFPARTPGRPRVVIVGGGFAGLHAVRALRDTPCDVVLLDRRNHHCFQPLLYQVATAALSPGEIAAPLRHIVRRIRNCRVALAEAVDVDPAARTIRLDTGDDLSYDYLVLACGGSHDYFGNDHWAEHAPGLKTIEDARTIRQRILLAFERAEYAADQAERDAALTFAIIGAGPTGVELAGAITEIAMRTMPGEFRTIDPRDARVVLFEAGPRLLPAFPAELGERAKRDLEAMGVDVRTNTMVSDVQQHAVTVSTTDDNADDDAEPDHAPNVTRAFSIFWAAGVKASPLGAQLGERTPAETDKAGRVAVEPDLSVAGFPDIFVAGDLAQVVDQRTGDEVPGVAPAAIQMGKHIGRTIHRAVLLNQRPEHREPFRYLDKGRLATIGKARAVADLRGWRFGGFFAWLLWSGVHIAFLVGFRNRLVVIANWLWNWVTFNRDVRLITGDTRPASPDEPSAAHASTAASTARPDQSAA
jgi:NADH dehydrogenase